MTASIDIRILISQGSIIICAPYFNNIHFLPPLPTVISLPLRITSEVCWSNSFCLRAEWIPRRSYVEGQGPRLGKQVPEPVSLRAQILHNKQWSMGRLVNISALYFEWLFNLRLGQFYWTKNLISCGFDNLLVTSFSLHLLIST